MRSTFYGCLFPKASAASIFENSFKYWTASKSFQKNSMIKSLSQRNHFSSKVAGCISMSQ